MATVTVRVDTNVIGYTPGSYLSVDNSIPAIATLISAGHLVVATPPAGVTATPGSGPSSAISLSDLTANAAVATALHNLLDSTYAKSGHLAGGGGTPTIANGAQGTGAALGSGATDSSGVVTVNALAAGMAAGALCTVTFGAAFTATPKIVLSDNSVAADSLYVSAKSATGFTVSCRTAPTASQVITFDYHVVA